MLEGVDRPVARSMMANLDLRHLLGIPGSCMRGRGRKAPLLPFYEKHKALHPTKVLLVRVRLSPAAGANVIYPLGHCEGMRESVEG